MCTSSAPSFGHGERAGRCGTLGEDVELAPALDRGDDAVIAAIDPAVQRIAGQALGRQADDQAVGARRRPWFEDAHGLDVRALHRLEEGVAGAQPRRDPVARIDLAHHAPAIGGLAQHELDELGAGDERGEPEAAAAAGERREG